MGGSKGKHQSGNKKLQGVRVSERRKRAGKGRWKRPPTILESFAQKLPTTSKIRYGVAGNYQRITSAGALIVNAEPITVFLKEDVSVYESILRKHFPDDEVLQDHMPAMELYNLCTEADVMRISYLQLIHPVNMALQSICPPNTELVCNTEACAKLSRFDMQWALYDENDKKLRNLAILEFKNTHVLDQKDFKDAAATEDTLEKWREKAFARHSGSLLKKNALLLSKQVTKYAENCHFVGLFSWKTMVLFNYKLYNTSQIRDEAVRGFVFQESGPIRGMTFRRLLFAFVARAIKEDS